MIRRLIQNPYPIFLILPIEFNVFGLEELLGDFIAELVEFHSTRAAEDDDAVSG